jgi:enamine deaminase RidA (YjgF/YER057c/UK114 family)
MVMATLNVGGARRGRKRASHPRTGEPAARALPRARRCAKTSREISKEGRDEMSKVEERLAGMGVTLPAAAAPVANYVPFVRTGNLVVVSGQICLGADGKVAPAHKGKLGAEVSDEAGREAARLCAINLLAQLKAAVGDLDKVVRCVRLGGFINATPTYGAVPQVMNGASDLMVEALGDAGRHARSTIGVAQLPLDAAVEVEGMFEVA